MLSLVTLIIIIEVYAGLSIFYTTVNQTYHARIVFFKLVFIAFYENIM